VKRRPGLSAVLVTWDAADHVAGCLAALRGSARRARADLEVVVVDNASRDDTLATVGASANVVVANPVNAGFAVACCQGIARASAPWALLLNPDVTVHPDFVARVAAAIAEVPDDVAVLVPELRLASDADTVNCRGLLVDELGIPAEIGSGRPAASSDPLESRWLFGGSGGCSVVHVEALLTTGALEPAYFAYLEDVDLAWRLQRRGLRARPAAGARAAHVVSAGAPEGSPLKTYLVARNRRLLFRVHGPHGVRVRLARGLTELGHAAVQTALTRRPEPVTGRVAALRLRRYARFLAASDRALAPARHPVPLAPRVGLGAALRRKRALVAAVAARRRVAPA
jgi:GT2 family glycosyltransferase